MEFERKKTVNEPINDLINIVGELRDPNNGCPWDKAQTHNSLIPFVLEEAHEVAHAIREGDLDEIKEELGDLLLQVVLHAQIAQENKEFCFADICQTINQKLIRRHPHIFQAKKTLSLEEVNKNWDIIKSKEKNLKPSKSPISDNLQSKIRSQSAITGSITISKKLAISGFEWPSIHNIWDKLEEEIIELKEALKTNNIGEAQSELGDVMFTLINIARWYGISPEEGLAETNKRFLNRFSFIEENLNGKIKGVSRRELKSLWQKAKEYLKSKG